ncbi:MAG: Rieske (2Fe-2S) protein [bacterium]|nr:Rieske (2Fe-2S) protein [bacterium]
MAVSKVDWVQAMALEALEENRPTVAYVKGIPILLIRTNGDVNALANCCPHMGCPLADGLLEGDYLRCPCHEWSFDIETGELWEAAEIRVRTYRVKVESGFIWVWPWEQ